MTVKIRTKYQGPTNSHGGRIVVQLVGAFGRVVRRMSVPYDYASTDMHTDAVKAFLGYKPENWGDILVRKGATRSGRGWNYELVHHI